MENDLISRSALITHIGDLGIDPEYDTMFLTVGQACEIAHKCIVAMVKEEPTVDAVEVVRCKDCKHCFFDLSGRAYHLCMRHGLTARYRVQSDDFCSYGERRVDDAGKD